MQALSLRSIARLGPVPIWLLIAAWFCANSPQSLTFELVSWVGTARHFTHQQRLTAEVTQLLTGKTMPHMQVAKDSTPIKPSAPAIPADATIKKIDLTLVTALRIHAPQRALLILSEGTRRALPAPVREGPDEPPRPGCIA